MVCSVTLYEMEEIDRGFMPINDFVLASDIMLSILDLIAARYTFLVRYQKPINN